jgi:hypothetical protein
MAAKSIQDIPFNTRDLPVTRESVSASQASTPNHNLDTQNSDEFSKWQTHTPATGSRLQLPRISPSAITMDGVAPERNQL